MNSKEACPTPQLPKRRLKRIAYHEAGHVVAYWHTGLISMVKSVSITPQAEIGGRVAFAHKEIKTSPLIDQYLIMGLLAGPIAEAKYSKRGLRHAILEASSDPRSDYGRAMEIASDYPNPSEKYEHCKDLSRKNINTLWPAVIALADELLNKGNITGKQAVKIMKNSMSA